MIATTLLSLVLGCDAGAPPAEVPCALPARASATPVVGDANGDGVVDIADGSAVHRWLFRRGTAPPCAAAADALPDGVVDAGDGASIWYHLFAGSTALSPLESGTCAAPTEPEPPACGVLPVLEIEAPADAFGPSGGVATVEARVTLTTHELDVEALSLGVQAEGCSILAATFSGTKAAELGEPAPGLRDGGFARADVTADADVIAAVAWDIAGDAVLPASGTSADVLALTLSAPVGAACAPCSLSVVDGLVGAGTPVVTVVSARGLAYIPERRGDTIQVCPN